MDSDTKHLHIEFFVDAVENPALSRKEGRPIFEDKEMVRIRWAGDNKRELVAPAHERCIRNPDMGAFPPYLTRAEVYGKHYEAFKSNMKFIGTGTPLDEVTFLGKSEIAELKAFNVHTVEALAALDGTNLQRLGMGAREKKNKAQAYLDKAKDNSVTLQLAEQKAAMEEELNRMRAEMAELRMTANRPAPKPSMPPALPEAPIEEDASPATSPFTEWAADDIKRFLKERTGQLPRGNPSQATLVRMADDILAKEQEAA